MNLGLMKKAIGLALRGRLWLLPIDSREEVGLSINKNKTMLLVFPDFKHLDSSKNERGVEATLMGHYLLHAAQNINEKHFLKWFNNHFKTEKKGKNK